MSVSGKPDDGDVYFDKEGYLIAYFKNASGCWYRLYLSPEAANNSMWLSSAMPDASCFGKKVMNIKELFLTVRKELQDEPSS